MYWVIIFVFVLTIECKVITTFSIKRSYNISNPVLSEDSTRDNYIVKLNIAHSIVILYFPRWLRRIVPVTLYSNYNISYWFGTPVNIETAVGISCSQPDQSGQTKQDLLTSRISVITD